MSLIALIAFFRTLHVIPDFFRSLEYLQFNTFPIVLAAFFRMFVLLPLAGLVGSLGYLAAMYKPELTVKVFSVLTVCALLIPGVMLIALIISLLSIFWGIRLTILGILGQLVFPYFLGPCTAVIISYFLLLLLQIDPLPGGIRGAFDAFIGLIPGNFQAEKKQNTNRQTASAAPAQIGMPRKESYMTQTEYNSTLIPDEFKPISMWGYFGYEILFAIPCVGFILLLVFSFGGTKNVNLKNFARSYFCFLIIVAILALIILAFGGFGVLNRYFYYY